MPRKTLPEFVAETLPTYSDLRQIAGDASFRRYFRVKQQGVSYVVMDAPPSHENAELFVLVATAFAQAGVNVPDIVDTDTDNGYLLLSDFGDELLHTYLVTDAEHWLPVCLAELFRLQSRGGQHLLELPDYDANLLLQELSLFREWFVCDMLQQKLTIDEEQLVNDLYKLLIDTALKQPQTWVHRDYHCRNLLKVGAEQIGVIDFQDAVFGPVTYDLVSLLKDCYLRYPKAVVAKYLQDYYARLLAQDYYYQDFEQFERDFDFMGLQRHLKVLGIFSRLSLRDGKHSYLNDLPLVVGYVLETLGKYHELHSYLPLFQRLATLFEQRVLH